MLLKDEEIRELTGHTTSYEPKENQINYSLSEVREINKAQLKKIKELIELSYVEEGNNLSEALAEFYRALLEEVK